MDGWCGCAIHWDESGNHGLYDSHRGGRGHSGRFCLFSTSCAFLRSVCARFFISSCKALCSLPCTSLLSRTGFSGGVLPSPLLSLTGSPCALQGRENLLCLMALCPFSPKPEPPGRFPVWSEWGLGPGLFPFADSPAGAVGTFQPPRWLVGAEVFLYLNPGARLPGSLFLSFFWGLVFFVFPGEALGQDLLLPLCALLLPSCGFFPFVSG